MVHWKKAMFFFALFVTLVISPGILPATANPAPVEDGLYVGGSSPLMITLDDFVQRTDECILILNKHDFAKIYFVQASQMATLQEIAQSDDLFATLRPVDLSKLMSSYTRFRDGSKLMIREESGEEAPEVEFIR